VVLLDERGTEETSAALAKRVARWQAQARDVALVIGGSDGLSDAVRARGDEVLALSRMTLPHRLARVVLLEQLYRAMTILRGEPYHK
jgi:23S rRNA (pseudouridine1915-N3)-methyltransferase